LPDLTPLLIRSKKHFASRELLDPALCPHNLLVHDLEFLNKLQECSTCPSVGLQTSLVSVFQPLRILGNLREQIDKAFLGFLRDVRRCEDAAHHSVAQVDAHLFAGGSILVALGLEPVILEHRYVVKKFCPDLSQDELAGSLYALWTDKYRLDIVGADQAIRAVCIRGEEAKHLNVRKGSAGFLVISTGYLSGGVPLWWEQTVFRGDAYEFQNRLGPIQTARPAAGALLDLEKPGQSQPSVEPRVSSKSDWQSDLHQTKDSERKE